MRNIGISMNGVFTILCLAGMLAACTNDEVGFGKDTIKLSEKEVQLPASQSTYIITTQGTFWWINELYLAGNQIDYSSVDTTRGNFLIDNPEFSIERINSTQINIQLSTNTSGVQRELLIYLQAGNYGDRIKVVQSGQ